MAPKGLPLPATAPVSMDVLPPGTELLGGQYRITGFMNDGGFGITYLAKDSLSRDIVIKECFAQAFCRRSGTRVLARSPANQGELDSIIRYFLNEARNLSGLSHPNVPRVHQVFQDNDTAYMALDYIRGEDLLQIIEDKRVRFEPHHLVSIAKKMLTALSYIHANHILHCDVSPDNIIIDQDGNPILIDFGAARQQSGDLGRKVSCLRAVKDGYSPHELYFAGGNSGPWSDLYSLGASLYHTILGTAPVNSQNRLAAVVEQRPDPHKPLAGSVQGFPPGFLESIDKAMAAMPAARFQTAAEWLAELNHLHEDEGTIVNFLRKALGKTGTDRPEEEEPTSAAPPVGAAVSSAAEGAAAPIPSDSAAVAEPPATTMKGKDMTIELNDLRDIGGFIGGCVVDSETGLMMGSEGGNGFDLEAASAANTEVVRAKLRAIDILGLDDHIDDILISLGKQLHLIRPLEKAPSVFLYVALDKKAANLGLARVQVKKVEQAIKI